MAKKRKKIVMDGQEVELGKKPMEFTLELNIPQEDFDKLLSAMANIKSDKKVEKKPEQNNQ